MQDSQYRSCVWCYQPLSRRRIGRYCCHGCMTAAAQAERCEYCGEPAQDKDHVVPRAFRRAMDGTRELFALLERMPDTVDACHECNMLAGSDVFDSLDEKRAAVHAKLERRYRRLLTMPTWDDDELGELSGRLRETVEAAEHTRRIVIARLSWRGNPRA